EEAIAALLTHLNIEEAARSISVPPNTLLKWQKLPEFDAAYRDARKATYRQAVARLQQGTSAAANTLLKTSIDPATPASVKVRAAEAIFNHAEKAIEIEDVLVWRNWSAVQTKASRAGGNEWQELSDASGETRKPDDSAPEAADRGPIRRSGKRTVPTARQERDGGLPSDQRPVCRGLRRA